MGRPRISILGLAGLIAFVALALTCLLHASAPWASVVHVAYFATLATAPLGAIYLRREKRAFYLGFAIWAWIYLFVSLLDDESVSDDFLDWAYGAVIPAGRQATEQRLQQIDLPRVSLDDGQTLEQLSDLVDIRDKDGLIAEGVQVSSKQRAGPSNVRLVLHVDAVTAGRLADATLVGTNLTVSNHRPLPFAILITSPPVSLTAFKGVGHAILGILAGLVGGMVGWRFYAIREAEAVSGG